MKIRTTCPQKGNRYYNNRSHGGLSDAINGKPMIAGLTVLQNCVGWANSRFNEINNDPELSGIVLSFKYQLVCNAEDFIESARAKGLTISRTPVEGGIMVWQKGRAGYGGDGAGHVAVVEEVYTDGSILTSESGYNAWTFKTVRRSNTDGRWGQNSAYKFRGCIVNPGVPDPKVVPVPPLVVDGIGGESTVMASQHFFGTIEDGVVSGQVKSLMSKYCPSLIAVQYNLTRSTFVEKLQAWLGVNVDGVIGKATVTAWQQKLMAFGYEIGAYGADGIFGEDSMRAWQLFLNDHQDKHPDPEPTPIQPKDYTNIIDVSEFQSSIDWNKVKADGYVGAIIRCAGRGGEKGNIYYDTKFFDHIRGAHSAGLKVGTYFLTQAINDEEGREEARTTLDLVSQAGIALDYPIGIDSENVTWKNKDGSTGHGRANSNKLSAAKRTEAVGAFCDEIQKNGFKAMIYASTSWLNNQLEMSKLPYYVWVAQWSSVCEYKGAYIIWQYGKGSVSGIKEEVDLNKCYYNGGDPTPAPEPSPEPVPKKHIEEDGIAGKATIERAQTVFGTLVDGIVSGQKKDLIQKYCPALRAVVYNKVKSTLVQSIQRWAGVKDDGIWGKDTSIAVQHKLQSEGYDIGSWGADGIFSTASMKAFQKWLNDHDKPTPDTPKPAPTPSGSIFDKGVNWLYNIANDNSWHYVKYNSKDAKTKECPICHNHAVGKYHGWNCIGESFAFWRHGCGIPCNCANNVINNAVADKLLKQSDAEALTTLRKKIGLNDIQVIRNGGKDIPQTALKRGDICLNYRSGKYYHTFPYIGDGYTIDCGNYSSTAKQIAKRKAPTCKVAIRYIGK